MLLTLGEYMSYSTPDLCDEHFELIDVLEPMMANYGGRNSFGGEIVTIKCYEDNSLVKENVRKPGHGKVLVVDGGGSLRRALLGDLIAGDACRNGWEGIIIYGCVRDVDALVAMDLGIQAIGSIPVKTEKRGIGDLNIPITFGGVTFSPGAYVYADNNGVIVSSISLF
jgi:regulator of ribonuclease activity A|tara:strand:- start:10222 stop:10725 length:504 start_codon:yes stop_codon:yes gene_type:complete